ncbi:uncharacterized protein LOC134706992 [Mytilus trossulus]|uniref:uncharacterized protein LOC134706992 n=1 Tax=Mytilus trossulus TaxID=6551 RepID=UPI0030061A31
MADLSLWSWRHDFDNRFVYYLTGGISLMYVVTLVMIYYGNPRTPKVVDVRPLEDMTQEKKLHKYLLIVDTSQRPGVSCTRETSIFIQLTGEMAISSYFKVAVFDEGKFIFQRGCKDLILFRIKEYLGQVIEVKMLVTNLKWRPEKVEVVKTSTGERFVVPVRVVYPGSTSSSESGTVYPVAKRNICKVIFQSVLQYHHWISMALGPNKFGAYTGTMNILLIFFGISSLLMSTLIVYILIQPETRDSVYIDMYTFTWCSFVTGMTFVSAAIFEFMLRNIRSGYLPDIVKFKNQMNENEEKPTKSNRLHTYLEEKKYNFTSETEIKSQGSFNSEDDEPIKSAVDLPELKKLKQIDNSNQSQINTNHENIDNNLEYGTRSSTKKFQGSYDEKNNKSDVDNYCSKNSKLGRSQLSSNDELLAVEYIQPGSKTAIESSKHSSSLMKYLGTRNMSQNANVSLYSVQSRGTQTNWTRRNKSNKGISHHGILVDKRQNAQEIRMYSSSRSNWMSQSDEAVQIKQVFHTNSDVINSDTPKPTHTDTGLAMRGNLPTANLKKTDEIETSEKSMLESETSVQHSKGPPVTWSDIGVSQIDDRGNRILMSASQDEIQASTSRINCFQQFVEDWDDTEIISIDDLRHECSVFLKQLVSHVGKQEKYLKKQIRHGDTRCFTGLEVIADRWFQELRTESYKFIIYRAFQKGVTKAVLKHNLEAMPEIDSIITSWTTKNVCTVIEQCSDKLNIQNSLSKPDIEEISYKIMVRIYNLADRWCPRILLQDGRQLEEEIGFRTGLEAILSSKGSLLQFQDLISTSMIHIQTQSDRNRNNNGGIIETLTSQASMSTLNSSEYLVLYTLASCVVRLAFQNQDWILREDWDKITQGSTPRYLDEFFRQQQSELLTVWKLCSNIVDEAQEELDKDYKDASFVYTQFLVRQLALSSLEDLIKDDEDKFCERYKELRSKLYKQWSKQGFHQTLNTMNYLPEVLLSNYIAKIKDQDHITDDTSPYFILSQSHSLDRIKAELGHTIMTTVKENLYSYGGRLFFLTDEYELKSLMDRGDFHITEHTFIMVDSAVVETFKMLPDVTNSLLTCEIQEYVSAMLVNKAVDSARHVVMLEKQIEKQKREPTKINMTEFASVAKSLGPMVLFLKNVKARNTIKPKDFVAKMENKHTDFVAVNLQNVYEAGLIRDDAALDRSITPKILYELEWDVTNENKKSLPHFVKSWLVVILFTGIFFNLMYVTFVGGQLSLNQIKAWLLYWLCSVTAYGFVLLPILAIVVGLVAYLKQ